MLMLFLMKRLILVFITFTSFGQGHVHLTEKVDPDIIIINIEEGDRAFIGKLLLTIDSCNPKLIAIDAWFINEKDSYQDSILVTALRLIDNDILGYTLDPDGLPLRSHYKFRNFVSGEGLAVLDNIDGISSHITPVHVIEGEEHELLPLTIVKKWKPDFINRFDKDETIPIEFTRTLDQFVHFNGSGLTVKSNFQYLQDKVVLLGYLGPSNEDKHFSPIRQVMNYKDGEPDTYGVVIIANEILTILNRK